MSTAETSKVKHSYCTDKCHEEKLQAAKLDVKQWNIPAHAAACFHEVRSN
jgi:hypothetical protein